MREPDEEWLAGLGIVGLPPQGVHSLLQAVHQQLEISVGSAIAANLSDEQLAQFGRLVDADDHAGALEWLTANTPDYPQVVAEQLEVIAEELRERSDEIMAAYPDSSRTTG